MMIKSLLHSNSSLALNRQVGPDMLKDNNFASLSSRTPRDLRMIYTSQVRSASGIHRLPDEILSSIFFNAIQVYDNDDPSEAAYFPLTISHTCSRWRKVSISTGSLWTSIRLCLPHSSNQLTYLKTWLSRSKLYSLDILLDFRDEDWGWEEDDHLFTRDAANEIISIILPHVKRWRHIEFFTDTWVPIHAFLNLTQDVVDLPVLKSVALSRCNAYFARKGECFKPVEMGRAIPLFGGAHLPALQDLSLVGVHVDWRRSILVNLLELELKFHAYDVVPDLGEFVTILKSCPDLERLSIVGWGPRLDATFTGPKRVMSMEKLTRFVFGFVDVEYAVMLLSLFRLPSICELELEDVSAIVDPAGPSDATSILNLLSFSSTNSDSNSCFFPLYQIERLELRSIRSSEAVFAQFLHYFNSLEKIDLSDVDSALLSSLGPQRFSPGPEPRIEVPHKARSRRPSFVSSLSTSLAPCPQLVDLTCRRVDMSLLSSVIFARAEAGSGVRPLQLVQLELDDDDNESDDGASTTSGLSCRDRTSLLNTGVELIINHA
ncbi:hypothetical protein F5050DRAFT_621873 [Lentinula boryana]|uniref:F-box domain-containing protein n=1 Tax=Lentinula boryana TaxID=40481 RepID=A0ABQ8Q5N4_9AGAR|nr:hypothetical protein F5050DRAFT_621873 [Lentinula boryana]